MGIRLEDLPPVARAAARDQLQRETPSLSADGAKRNAQPVLVCAPVFCTRCGSYEHHRPLCDLFFPLQAQIFALPLRTENTGNGTHRNHFAEAGRRKRIRKSISAAWAGAGVRLRPAGYRVTVTRISAGNLDAGNLDHALKTAIDSIASLMGVDDASPLVEWGRKQERGEKGKPAIRIEIEELS